MPCASDNFLLHSCRIAFTVPLRRWGNLRPELASELPLSSNSSTCGSLRKHERQPKNSFHTDGNLSVTIYRSALRNDLVSSARRRSHL